MCQFVETICIKDGTARHLHYHVERMQRTIRHFFPHMPMVAESDLLCDVPTIEGLQKARVVYDEHGIIERTFAPYSRPVPRLKALSCPITCLIPDISS